MRRTKAKEIIAALNELEEVKDCTIYGSLASGTDDALSDIDIEVDVSGCDNGKFMLALPELLVDKIDIYYADYAPSLVPEYYIISLALDESDPFLIADIRCCAEPHCQSVTRERVTVLNGKFTHTLKLWTANLKHYARGADCRGDILRMAAKLGMDNAESVSEKEMLAVVLRWIEDNVELGLETFVAACRRKFEELI